MTPNPKDLAEFARLSRAFGVMGASPIVAWADHVINEHDQPPMWAIDLALAGPQDVDDLLNQVPGGCQGNLSLRLFLAYVRRLWNAEQLTIGEVRAVGWDLYRENAGSESERWVSWGHELECDCDALDYGFCTRTEKEIRESISEKLAQFSDLDPLLPHWATNEPQPPKT